MSEHEVDIARIWTRLESAPRRPGEPFRTPTVATVSPRGRAEVRTVVLRAASAASRTLVLHTDTASAKYLAIRHSPHTALCFWDPHTRVQVRLNADAYIEEGSDVKDMLAAMKSHQRRQYATSPPPGTPIPEPEAYEYGRPHRFARILCVARTMDVLWLTRPRHRRLHIDWSAPELRSTWLVP